MKGPLNFEFVHLFFIQKCEPALLLFMIMCGKWNVCTLVAQYINQKLSKRYRSERDVLSRTKLYENLPFAISLFRRQYKFSTSVCLPRCDMISVQTKFDNFENLMITYGKLRFTRISDKWSRLSWSSYTFCKMLPDEVCYVLCLVTNNNYLLKGFVFFYCRKYDFHHYQLM